MAHPTRYERLRRQSGNMMRKPRAPAPGVTPLEQQKTDFTSEGAPLPGNVGSKPPATELADVPPGVDDVPESALKRV